MNPQIVFINGPPGSGKDTVANLLCNNHDNWTHMKFAGTLKMGLAVLLGLDLYEAEHYFETPAKNGPGGPFVDVTPRKALIELSESYMKPLFGADIFGRVAANIAETVGGNIVFSDCGFEREVESVAQLFGPNNCKVIRISREGCSFNGDSRNYLDPYSLPNGIRYSFIKNDYSIEELQRKVELFVFSEE